MTWRELCERMTEREAKPEDGKPAAWLQWKGTDACMDVFCVCGALGHLDGSYSYRIVCSACGRTYWANGHIELIPLTDEEVKAGGEETCTVRAFADEAEERERTP